MDTTSFDRISVEMIVKSSGVSKSTFYRHFRDKYDLLNYNAMALTEHLIGQPTCAGWHDFFLYMFEAIVENERYYKRAFRSSGQNAHSRFLSTYSFSVIEKCYLAHCNKPQLSTLERYIIGHYCHGCVGILQDWLNEHQPLTPGQMADIFYDAMPLQLQDAWVQK